MANELKEPPKWIDTFVGWYCKESLQDEVLGDLYELYLRWQEKFGPRKANWLYFFHAIIFIRPYNVKSIFNVKLIIRTAMFRNYFISSFRFLARQKLYTSLNIFGLAAGILSSMFIFLWIQNEVKVDSYHKDLGRIYRYLRHVTTENGTTTTGSMPVPAEKFIESNYPEVEQSALFSWEWSYLVSYKNKHFKEVGRYVEPNFFEIFTRPILAGDASTIFKDLRTVAISETLAQRYFGYNWQTEAVGKLLKIGDAGEFEVTAVFEDVPYYSSLELDFAINAEAYFQENNWVNSWGNNGFRGLVKLKEGASHLALNDKIKEIVNENVPGQDVTIFLHPYKDYYLNSEYKNGELVGGRIEYVQIFFITALFILLIASINFMNLSTARSINRSKEIGVRKVLGAKKGALRFQFLIESLLVSFSALSIALVALHFLLPFFNRSIGMPIELEYSNFTFWAIALGCTLFTGFFAGIYPAFVLSSFKILNILKGKVKSTPQGILLRKSLVIFQFSISILLIIGTLAVFQQLQFIQNKDIGFDRENVMMFSLEGDLKTKFDLFEEKLKGKVGVLSAAAASSPPLSIGWGTESVKWEGKDPASVVPFTLMNSTYELLPTLKLRLVQGRNFSKQFATDSSAVIINQNAAKAMGIENPVGTTITMWGDPVEIIGMVEDFHFSSMYNPIEPLIFMLNLTDINFGLVKIGDKNIQENVASVQQVIKEIDPNYPLNYNFLDDTFNEQYKSEQSIGHMANYFSFIAILISCLGLFGLATYSAQQRNREISIRKVLGASVNGLVVLLSKDLAILVFISFFLASPLAYYFVSNWLNGFEYKIELGLSVFLLAGGVTFLVAVLTVGFKSLWAALSNPADILRNE